MEIQGSKGPTLLSSPKAVPTGNLFLYESAWCCRYTNPRTRSNFRPPGKAISTASSLKPASALPARRARSSPGPCRPAPVWTTPAPACRPRSYTLKRPPGCGGPAARPSMAAQAVRGTSLLPCPPEARRCTAKKSITGRKVARLKNCVIVDAKAGGRPVIRPGKRGRVA